MNILRHIQVTLPNTEPDVTLGLLETLSQFGAISDTTLKFTTSQAGFSPEISLDFAAVVRPQALFTSDLDQVLINIENSTGQSKQSPHSYNSISMASYLDRTAKVQFTALDHIGFDLPWFDGIHPVVRKLQSELIHISAYHRSFTGEDWDFILPASEEELSKPELKYNVIRRPKFEIVSLSKASTPIVQFDLLAQTTFDELVKLFPEGIADPDLQNVWVYIKNSFGIDICTVIGVDQSDDWSHMFKGFRLT